MNIQPNRMDKELKKEMYEAKQRAIEIDKWIEINEKNNKKGDSLE